MGTEFSYFATCPKGVEDLLARELGDIGARDVKIGAGGVHFSGELAAGYRACLWSRVANRVLCVLDQSSALPKHSHEPMYDFVKAFPWEQVMSADTTFAVDFSGTTPAIKNTQFGAVRVKDAIVDRFVALGRSRPDVDRLEPQIRVNARLYRDVLTLALDMSGESLHKRGYRADTGIAPLKENLAAAILLRAGWPEIAAAGGALVDPMCGSGTFLIEGAFMALDRAPGLERRFGFEHWLRHEPDTWHKVLEEARERDNTSAPGALVLYGFDSDSKVLKTARTNVARAGCAGFIQTACADVVALTRPEEAPDSGLLIVNPPYGERLGQVQALEHTYLELAQTAKAQFGGWQLGVFSGNSELARQMRLRPKKRNKLFNGNIPSELLLYDVLAEDAARLRTDSQTEEDLSPGSLMVLNRLRKNKKRLDKWLKGANTNAYRLYDADMPEYAAAIDVYGDQLHLQEYAPPKTVDDHAARKRLRELISALAVCFGVPRSYIIVKTRKRNRGSQQYESRAQKSGEFFTVREGRAGLLVNLVDYLDTGLFLDHRPLRKRIAKEALGKQFLNLFCYTASGTVQAALGGAKRSVSVDMSKTYIDWARKNLELNRINHYEHQLVQADCLRWLDECRQGFDLIMLDPPTFSNSARMEDVLDIQRDHVALITRCMELLLPGGTLYFSNNLQSFKLDEAALAGFTVNDISAQTIDEDFKRNPKIHSCFQIKH